MSFTNQANERRGIQRVSEVFLKKGTTFNTAYILTACTSFEIV